MKRRVQVLPVNSDDMSIREILEPGKIKVIILDGIKGKASSCEAVEHGETVIETINGKSKRIIFRDSEQI